MKHTWKITAGSRDLAGVARDFERLRRPMERSGVILAGPDGFDEPTITPGLIEFNGAFLCNHAPVKEYGRNDGALVAQLDSGGLVPVRAIQYAKPLAYEVPNPFNRPCTGTCKAAPFRLEVPESGVIEGAVETGGRPYDIAVAAALYLAKRRLKDAIEVSSDHQAAWSDVVAFCNHFLDVRGRMKFA